jgi:hypothetical protein
MRLIIKNSGIFRTLKPITIPLVTDKKINEVPSIV